jgi:drug/metabolite transporter (DMT)-like permease
VKHGDARRGRLYVALAAIAWSTAGLFQRELTVGIGTQLAGRALFAVIGLVAFVAVAERGGVVRSFRAIGRGGLAVAALMAVSSGAFIIALNYTSVANVLFMQALAPVLAAVLGTFVGEPVARRTWLAMAVAVAGVALMVGGPSHPSLAGVSLSLLMSISFAGVIVITRHLREVSMAPATCLSQAIVFVCAVPFASTADIGPQDLALRALEPGRRGRADHAARDRARATLGVDLPRRAAKRDDDRRRGDRPRCSRDPGIPPAGRAVGAAAVARR